MARDNANSLLNSLKGKIWIAAGALAFFVCTFGLISYLLVSFVVSDPFYAVFVPFLFLALTMMLFGWWLSNEVARPLEKLTLLARSLERSSSTSLPRSSGAQETDELLQALHRNSLQMQKLVGLMDEVAAGKTDVALTPLEGSDRLVSSFQRLLAKITDSIDAKQKLEKLETAIERVSGELARVRAGHLDVEVANDGKETHEISETLRYLLDNLILVVEEVRADAARAQTATAEIGRTLQQLVQQDENKIQEMHHAAFALGEVPNRVQRIAENFAASAAAASQSIEKARRGTRTAQENSQAVAALRKQLHEAVSRIGRLQERSLEIAKIAKTVGDLAHRTKMIALNASLHADESGANTRAFAVVGHEIERLSKRAEETNKQISSLNKSMMVEIGEVERTLKSTVAEAANLSRFALETGNSLSEVEKHIAQFLGLQEQFNQDSQTQAAETERAFQVFVGSIAETEMAVDSLRQSEKAVSELFAVMESLRLTTAGFKLAAPAVEADEAAPGAGREPAFATPEDFLAPAFGPEIFPDEDAENDDEPLELADYPPSDAPELLLINAEDVRKTVE